MSVQTTTDGSGAYSFTIPADTYTVSASAWGYTSATSPGAVVTAGGTTTRNLALVMAPQHTLSGVVTDAATGWPLYAKISIAGYPGGDLWTDPVAGTYSVQLPDGTAVSLTASAWVSGYTNAADAFAMPAANLAKNYALAADLTACAAPGYAVTQGTVFFAESFETAVPPGFPSGWAVADVSGTLGDWLTATASNHPSGWAPHGGSNLAYFNSYYASDTNSTRLYRTAGLNLTGAATVYCHFWLLHDTGYASDTDRVQVQVSTDGGTTWQNVGTAVNRYDGSSGWKLHSIQLTGYSGSTSDVRLGLLGISSYGNDVHLDDLSVSTTLPACTAPPTGGLAVGNAYDANTSASLVGATVDNGTSNTTTRSTADPSVDEGLYVLYCAEGTQNLTASMGGYQDQIQGVSVPHHGAVRQDFRLGAPRLQVAPASLSEDVPVGGTKDATLTLSNTGTAPATFDILEYPASSAPLIAKRLPYKRRSAVSSDPSDKAPLGQAPLTTSWGTGAVIPTGGRYRSAGVSPDGRFLYMFGGFDPSNSVLAESWKYDSQTDVWTALAPMPTALTAMEAAVVGGYIYLVGGYTGAAHTNNFQIYDILGNSWQATTWPNARTPMTAVWHDQLFAFGGNPGPSGETWKYTPGTGVWTGPLSPMPTPAGYGAAVTVGDYIFVIGGTNGSSPEASIQRYDPATDTWDTSGPALPGGRMSPGAIWYGDYLYVSMGGGVGGDYWTPYNDTLILNAALWPAGSWTAQGEVVPTPLVGPACDCIKNSFYLIGGTGGSGASDANQNLNDGKFCHFNADLPWLSLSPTSGTIPAGASQPITVHFDASAYASPTVLHGQLGINHNTPYLVGAVPVTMNVTYEPMTATATASPTSGLAPLTVSFTGTASGGDGGPYTYEWDFDDGSPHLAEQNPTHTFSDEGTFTVMIQRHRFLRPLPLTTNHLSISVGALPAVTLVSPLLGAFGRRHGGHDLWRQVHRRYGSPLRHHASGVLHLRQRRADHDDEPGPRGGPRERSGHHLLGHQPGRRGGRVHLCGSSGGDGPPSDHGHDGGRNQRHGFRDGILGGHGRHLRRNPRGGLRRELPDADHRHQPGPRRRDGGRPGHGSLWDERSRRGGPFHLRGASRGGVRHARSGPGHGRNRRDDRWKRLHGNHRGELRRDTRSELLRELLNPDHGHEPGAFCGRRGCPGHHALRDEPGGDGGPFHLHGWSGGHRNHTDQGLLLGGDTRFHQRDRIPSRRNSLLRRHRRHGRDGLKHHAHNCNDPGPRGWFGGRDRDQSG